MCAQAADAAPATLPLSSPVPRRVPHAWRQPDHDTLSSVLRTGEGVGSGAGASSPRSSFTRSLNLLGFLRCGTSTVRSSVQSPRNMIAFSQATAWSISRNSSWIASRRWQRSRPCRCAVAKPGGGPKMSVGVYDRVSCGTCLASRQCYSHRVPNSRRIKLSFVRNACGICGRTKSRLNPARDTTRGNVRAATFAAFSNEVATPVSINARMLCIARSSAAGGRPPRQSELPRKNPAARFGVRHFRTPSRQTGTACCCHRRCGRSRRSSYCRR